MVLQDDCSGLESLPLKLIIVAVVVAMSVVPASNALESMRDRDFLARAGAQLDTIVAAAQIVSAEGPWSVRTLEMDFRSQGSLSFSRLMIGDEVGGAACSSVVLKLSTGTHMIRSATDPPASLASPDGGTLVIESVEFDLRLEARLMAGMIVVVAEVV